MQINLATSQDQKWTLFLANRAPNRDFEFALANCVQIAEGGGVRVGGKVPFSDLERTRIYGSKGQHSENLKVKFLETQNCHSEDNF